MEAVQAVKPRVSYAAVFAAQQTVGSILERYIAALELTPRPMGTSAKYTTRALARARIGSLVAQNLTKKDIKDHCEARLAAGVKPCTIDKDLCCLTVALTYAGSAWDDCEEVSAAAIHTARRYLVKQGLIAKSTPRKRIPTPEEIERLLDYFNRPNPFNRRRIPMERMTLWQYYSLRRVGESCRLLWEDWNAEAQTIYVRRMKDPRRRDKAKVLALTPEAQAMLVALWGIRDPNEPRIFPYRTESCVAAYVHAKKKTGIDGLRLHDSRRAGCTRLVHRGYTSAQSIAFSGHDTPNVFERVYLGMDAAKVVAQGPLNQPRV